MRGYSLLPVMRGATAGVRAGGPALLEAATASAGLKAVRVGWGRKEEVRLNGRKTAIFRPAEPTIHRASGLRRRPRPNWMAAQAQTGASCFLPHRSSGNVRSCLAFGAGPGPDTRSDWPKVGSGAAFRVLTEPIRGTSAQGTSSGAWRRLRLASAAAGRCR